MTGQPVIVDVFVSIEGWAGSADQRGYFGYSGPDLEQWITAEVRWPNSRICREDVAAHVQSLKSTREVPLRTMGSLSIARQLLGAGLVDRLRLMTFPSWPVPRAGNRSSPT